MRYSSKVAVEYDLQLHYKLRSQYLEEIASRSEYKDCRVKPCTTRKEKTFYSVKRAGQSKYKYAGDDMNEDVQAIREYRLYEKTLAILESNINVMETFIRIYKQTNAASISELLPSVYKLPSQDTLLCLEPEIDKWLSEKKALKSNYPIFDPDSLTVTAFDGTPMRSRAECVHHEAFFIYNVPDIYELPYKIGNDVLRPDFTALDVFTMTPKMFEHLGNWFHSNPAKRSRYRSDSVSRWDQYAEIGFSPESNLFLTFGAEENRFDAQAIHRKIAMLASPPPSEETMELLRRM